jgi:hypothetical protein
MRSLQVYQCSECLHRFTLGDASKHKSYPLKAILDTLSTYNSGHSLSGQRHRRSFAGAFTSTFPSER